MTQPPNSASPNIPKLPRISELGRDLIELGKVQLVCTIVLPFAFVTAYFAFAIHGDWPLAVFALVAYTFYSYGSISHDLVHGNLGLPRWLNHVLLSVIELLGVRSGHAYRTAHLHHHATFPHTDDVEAAAAHGSFLGALLAGPLHQARIWRWAWRNSYYDRRWILFEGAACVSMVGASVAMLQVSLIPLVYVALVILGSWTFPLFTAYLPHQPRCNSFRTNATFSREGRGHRLSATFLPSGASPVSDGAAPSLAYLGSASRSDSGSGRCKGNSHLVLTRAYLEG